MLNAIKPSISFVIPCLNEVEAVNPVLRRLVGVIESPLFQQTFSHAEIIVVDDGSSDDSQRRVAQFPGVRLIQHIVNQGYGAALKTGFKASAGDLITFLDMDSSYDPESITALYSAMQAKNLDMIFGCRFQPKSQMPPIRKFGNYFFAQIVRLFFTTEITDVCTGFRVFRKSLLPKVIALEEKGLNFSISLTLLAMKDRWNIGQLQIPYLEREGRSKLSVVKDGIAFMLVILRKSRL